jgi:hypothetical protein
MDAAHEWLHEIFATVKQQNTSVITLVCHYLASAGQAMALLAINKHETYAD